MLERLEPAKTRVNVALLKVGRPDLASMIGVVRRRWDLIGLFAVGFLIIGSILLAVVTPTYTAKISILLDPRRTSALDANAAAANGMPMDVGYVESEVAVIGSFNIARRVVEKLDLVADAEFGPRQKGFLSNLFSSIGDLLSRPSAEPDADDSKQLSPALRGTVERLRNDMIVRRNGLTYVIDASVTSRSPAKAASIANAVGDAYLVDRLEARYTAAQRATQWLNERLTFLKAQLETSEKAAASYRADKGLVSTAAGTIDKQQLSEINGQLVLARAKTAETRAKFEQAKKVSAAGGSLSSIGDVLASPLISSLRSQEAEVARREADLSTRYGSQHPQVVNVRAELADIRRGITAEVTRIVTNLGNEYDVAQKREKSLQESLDRLSGAAGRNDDAMIKLRELEREADSNRQIYENFLNKFKESREETTLESTESRVISPALPPDAPSFPRRGLGLAVALALGLFAGVGAAFLSEKLSSGFQTSEQVEETLGSPTLAMLPQIAGSELDTSAGDLAPVVHLLQKPFSRFAEGVRSIRTGVLLSTLDHPSKVVMVCSTVPGEGKSTVAASIASSSALSGKKVALIDCDLRNPSTSQRFGLRGKAGLIELLAGESSAQEAFYHPSEVSITVLPAGRQTTNPTDVLASQKMQQLVDALSERYDLVVLDCPPLLAVSDGLVLANVAQSIVYVIEWNRTAREAVKRALAMLDLNHGKIAGIVLNKVNGTRMRTYAYYNEYYSRGYDNYYHKK